MSKPRFTPSMQWVSNAAGQMGSEAQRILRALIDIAWNRTGEETSAVVTGTAGTNGNIAKWNADGDLVDGGKAAANLLDSPEMSDAVFRVTDNGDATKKLAFEVSGITTGTTRTWTVPDANVTVSSFAATLLDDADAATARSTLAVPAAANGVHTGTTTFDTVQLAANYYLQLLSGTTPLINFDANDFLAYDRTNNKLALTVGSTTMAQWGNVFTTEANIVSSVTASIANGAQQNLPNGSGLLIINSTNLGGIMGAFLVGGGVVTKLGGSSVFVSGAPAGGQIGVEWTGSVYRINNNFGSSATIAKYLVHTRLAN